MSRTPPTPAQAEAEGTLILVVDDHPTNRQVLVRQLNLLGYAADTAEDGQQALELWRRRRFGLMLADCNMPRMNGYELARAIREEEASDPGNRHIPIIAFTANALGGDASRCYAAGMDDYLSKPAGMLPLRNAIEKWLPPSARREGVADTLAVTPPPLVPLADDPVDPTILNAISGTDRTLACEILHEFRHTSDLDAHRITQAIDHSDSTALAQAAHRIKGASRLVGAHALAQACERLERAGHSGDWGRKPWLVSRNSNSNRSACMPTSTDSEFTTRLPAGLRLLIVEDHDFQRKVVAELLRRLGAEEIHEASCGRTALELMATLEPPVDIVISDLDMPGMDGMEFIRRLGESRHEPALIILSALEPSLIRSIRTMAASYGLSLLGTIEKPPRPMSS